MSHPINENRPKRHLFSSLECETKFHNKVAVITGANSGIGKAIAARFAAEGAHVCVDCRPDTEDAAQIQIDELQKAHGVESLAVTADVAKREQVEAMTKQIVAKFGRYYVNGGLTQ